MGTNIIMTITDRITKLETQFDGIKELLSELKQNQSNQSAAIQAGFEKISRELRNNYVSIESIRDTQTSHSEMIIEDRKRLTLLEGEQKKHMEFINSSLLLIKVAKWATGFFGITTLANTILIIRYIMQLLEK